MASFDNIFMPHRHWVFVLSLRQWSWSSLLVRYLITTCW